MTPSTRRAYRGVRPSRDSQEVVDVSTAHPWPNIWHELAYWTQWLALNLFGPATQDRESDPLEQLKRKYGHRPSP